MIAPIFAFDFDAIQSVIRQSAAGATWIPTTLYSNEMIDALVSAALAAANGSDAAE